MSMARNRNVIIIQENHQYQWQGIKHTCGSAQSTMMSQLHTFILPVPNRLHFSLFELLNNNMIPIGTFFLDSAKLHQSSICLTSLLDLQPYGFHTQGSRNPCKTLDTSDLIQFIKCCSDDTGRVALSHKTLAS